MSVPQSPTPKIELHVHLEGAVRPAALLEIARAQRVELPADNVEELAGLYEFSDFDHFIELWMMTTHVIRTEADFRQVVVSYAAEAAAHGAVYIEGIFTPAERISGGASWDEVFTGFCDGAAEATRTARRRGAADARHPPQLRSRSGAGDRALLDQVPRPRRRRVSDWAGGRRSIRRSRSSLRSASRRTAGSGRFPTRARPRASESIRGAVEVLRADRIRHGVRAVEDPGPARASSRHAGSCATSARCRTCGPERTTRSRPTRCRRCSRPACCARSAPTTPRCSTPTSRATTKPPRSLGCDATRRSEPACAARCATRPEVRIGRRSGADERVGSSRSGTRPSSWTPAEASEPLQRDASGGDHADPRRQRAARIADREELARAGGLAQSRPRGWSAGRCSRRRRRSARGRARGRHGARADDLRSAR